MNRKQLTIAALVLLSLCTVIGVYAGTVGVNDLFGFTTGYGFTDLNSTNVNAGTEFYRGGVNYTQFILNIAGAANPFDQDLNTTDLVTFTGLASDNITSRGFNVTQLAVYPELTASYIVWTDGANFFAKNGTTGAIDYSGNNATTVIQSSISGLTNGGIVFVKAGVYYITQLQIEDYIILTGEGGQRATEIGKDDLDGTVIRQTDGTNKHMIVNSDVVNGNVGIEISSIYFHQGNQVGDFDLIRFTKTWRAKITNVYLRGSSTTNRRVISIRGASEIIKINYVRTEGGGIYLETSNAVHITNSEIGGGTVGVEFNGLYHWNKILNTHIYSMSNYGVWIKQGNYYEIADNQIEDCVNHGLYAARNLRNSTISRNVIQGNGGNGIIIDSDGPALPSQYNIISENICLNNTGWGIEIESFNGIQTNYNQFIGNVLTNNGAGSLTEKAGLVNTIYLTEGHTDTGEIRLNAGNLEMWNSTAWVIIGNTTIINPVFDQVLNTTSSVVFQDLNITDEYNLGTQLDVNATINVNFEWSGQSAVLRAGENIAQGNLVYIDSSGDIQRTDADSNVTIPCVALALEAITNGNSGLILMQGWVYNSGWTLDEGDEVFVSTTVGAISTSAPSGSGDQVQVVGIGLTEDLMYFNPDYTVMEIT